MVHVNKIICLNVEKIQRKYRKSTEKIIQKKYRKNHTEKVQKKSYKSMRAIVTCY